MRSLIFAIIISISSWGFGQGETQVKFTESYGSANGVEYVYTYSNTSGTLIKQNISFNNFDGYIDTFSNVCYNSFAIYIPDQSNMSYSPELPNKWYDSGKPMSILSYVDVSNYKMSYNHYDESGKLISQEFYIHKPKELIFFEPCGTWWKLNKKGKKIKYEAPEVTPGTH